jgi:hypothetical protein
MCWRTVCLFDTLSLFFNHFFFFSRLHNYSNRTDSLDLNVFNVPKLLTTTCQLKEQISQQNPLLTPNGDIQLKYENSDSKQSIRKRITELECELNYLKSQLKTNFISDNP